MGINSMKEGTEYKKGLLMEVWEFHIFTVTAVFINIIHKNLFGGFLEHNGDRISLGLFHFCDHFSNKIYQSISCSMGMYIYAAIYLVLTLQDNVNIYKHTF
jgi:hypothetical protein